MPLEIERKFLLDSLPEQEADTTYHIFQFYTDDARYRIQTEAVSNLTKCFKTVKKTLEPGVNDEYEVEVPLEEVYAKLQYANKALHKTRYVYRYKHQKFEVDVLLHRKWQVMCEVEGKRLTDVIEWPDYLEEVLDREVTGDKQFNNSTLAINIPYTVGNATNCS